MSDPKYQIFISSTFGDLREAREAVTWEVLRLDQIPAGMENFSADSDRGWAIIQNTIDRSDYYLLILAGRYGSHYDSQTGLSWTEREYDYAHDQGIPIIAFIRRDSAITADNLDPNESYRRLQNFKQKVKDRHLVEPWSTIDDLCRRVGAALTKRIRADEGDDKRRRPGWYRGGGRGMLYSMTECYHDLLQVISSCDTGDDLQIQHLGLDLASSCDYIGGFITECNAGKIDYRLLMMAEQVEKLGPRAPEEAIRWSSYVPGSIARIQMGVRASVKSAASTIMGSARDLRVEIRQYNGLPVIHGAAFRGASTKKISYLSMCHFERKRNWATYSWGEFAFRKIAPGQATPSDQALDELAEGLFFNLWLHGSTIRWKFHATGNTIVEDQEFPSP